MAARRDLWCHECGCRMRLIRGKKGFFYGCTGYPTCKATVSEQDGQLEIESEEDRACEPD